MRTKRVSEVRQREIAQLARVSQATVSRVLNNDPQVNEELRQRVLSVMDALGYVPDARAQSLRAHAHGCWVWSSIARPAPWRMTPSSAH